MIEPYDVFHYYMALKLHFSSDYDCIKYNYKTSANQRSFYKRKDRYHFAKVGRQLHETNELIHYLVSQFLVDKKWIGDMIGKESDRIYSDYRRRHDSLTYLFEQDISMLSDKVDRFDDLFTISGAPYPLLVSEYLSESVNLESVVILNRMTGFMKMADKQVEDPIVWPGMSRLIWKYGSFVGFDKSKIRGKIFSVFSK